MPKPIERIAGDIYLSPQQPVLKLSYTGAHENNHQLTVVEIDNNADIFTRTNQNDSEIQENVEQNEENIAKQADTEALKEERQKLREEAMKAKEEEAKQAQQAQQEMQAQINAQKTFDKINEDIKSFLNNPSEESYKKLKELLEENSFKDNFSSFYMNFLKFAEDAINALRNKSYDKNEYLKRYEDLLEKLKASRWQSQYKENDTKIIPLINNFNKRTIEVQ